MRTGWEEKKPRRLCRTKLRDQGPETSRHIVASHAVVKTKAGNQKPGTISNTANTDLIPMKNEINGDAIVLELKDRQIISELSLNARATLSSIAKNLGLSKQVVKYRLGNLEKKKIIEGYYAILNINKLGYLYHRCFFKFNNIDLKKEAAIIRFCSNHKKIGWVFQHDGNWDFAVAVWAKNAIEFEEVLDEILHKYGNCFDDRRFSISTKIYHLKHKFLLGRTNSSALVLGGVLEEARLDEIDYEILGILAKSARKSFIEIGEMIGINSKLVKNRMDNLLRKKIILGFQVKLNHRILGYTHKKIFLQLTSLSKSKVESLIGYLKSLNTSIYITKAVGIADLEFELLVKTVEEFHDIMREMRGRFSKLIRGYSAVNILYEPVINYLPVKK